MGWPRIPNQLDNMKVVKQGISNRNLYKKSSESSYIYWEKCLNSSKSSSIKQNLSV